MADKLRNRGPWTHRALIWGFSFALGLLAYWLLGFVVNDIASWPGPEYAKLEEARLDPALVKEERAIQAEREEIIRQVEHREGRQGLLRDSACSSKQTMDQLLSIRRLGLEKNIEPTEAEKNALVEAEQLFLENQKAYQTLSQEIGELQEQLRTLATALDRRGRLGVLAVASWPVCAADLCLGHRAGAESNRGHARSFSGALLQVHSDPGRTRYCDARLGVLTADDRATGARLFVTAVPRSL